MATVSLTGVYKRFSSVIAVHDINLEIADGEFVVLVGPSGCGKSTTLRMIAGLDEVSEGSISFDGRDVTALSPSDRNTAMVFQSYALYPHMDVFENLAFPLRQRRRQSKSQISKTVFETAELLEITDLLKRRPKELSGGQRQRVAMGRAIVRQPEVFLFDEPLSNLDTALRAQMRIEIKKLHQKIKTTVVYVTHDQIEAMTLADRIAVMDKGEIVQTGDPIAVYRQPKTKFVAGFIGSPKMNFIPCRIEDNGHGVIIRLSANIQFLPPEHLQVPLRVLVGRNLELGIRPENIFEYSDTNGRARVRFEAIVEVSEPTGADTHVVFKVEDTEVLARCRPEYVRATGESMAFGLDVAGIILIDPASGKVIAG